MTSDHHPTEKTVELAKLPIELYALLKLEGLALSGGEAKHLINDGNVRVNGEIETRKRKKIVSGDRVELGGNALIVTGPTPE